MMILIMARPALLDIDFVPPMVNELTEVDEIGTQTERNARGTVYRCAMGR
jgi:hypothetical protein